MTAALKKGSEAPNMRDVRVIIPTLCAAPHLDRLLPLLAQQSNLERRQVLVVDSASDDDTVSRCREWGAEVLEISRSEFDHGGTRQMAAEHCGESPILIYMTQDAIPAGPNALMRLIEAFSNPNVGIAYGRQLPREEANEIERHARLYNYPKQNETRALKDAPRLGMKTCFCSDSFAAYRHDTLRAVGGFPEKAFFAEDQIVAGKMLIEGYEIAYCGEAEVVHSHGYSMREEMARYFDVGVFHNRNGWLLETYGAAEKAGAGFVSSEIKYLLARAPLRLPEAGLRTLLKYLGYRLGRMEDKLSLEIKAHLSMQGFYWRRLACEAKT